jgi:hypothetical protein
VLDLVRQLPSRPVTDGPAGLLRRFARHGDDLDDLLGSERRGAAGTWGIVEDAFDHRQELWLGEVVVFGLGQRLAGLEPAIAPEPDGDAVEAELLGDGLQARVGCQREEDEDAADQTLGSGLSLAKLLKAGPLTGREFEGCGRRAGHGVTRFFSRTDSLALEIATGPAAG